MRPFAIYPDSFGGRTLGYWRPGERGGLLDSVVAGGPTLAPTGDVTWGGDGWRLGEGGYLWAALPTWAAAQPTLTWEAWLRDWRNVADDAGYVLWLYQPAASTNRMEIWLRTGATPRIAAIERIAGTAVGSATWVDGAAVASLLASPQPLHVAVVLDSPARLTLYVNGVAVAQDTTNIADLPSGDWRLQVGVAGTSALVVVDEIRLSSAARYSAAFTPVRYAWGERACPSYGRQPGPGELVGGAVWG
jgi:hypothetical protein